MSEAGRTDHDGLSYVSFAQSEVKSMENYHKIETRLTTLLNWITSTTHDINVDDVREYIDVGEYGLAYDALCSILSLFDAPIPADIRAEIITLGDLMNIDPRSWGLAI
jgi:hypothetical protein